MKKLETHNKRLIEFYQANPKLSFETVNLLFLDIIEKLASEIVTTTTTTNTQLMTYINENTTEIMKSIGSLKETMVSITNENKALILSKLLDVKKDYVSELNSLIVSNSYEKVGSLIEKNNSLLIDKTQNIINEIIPKSQIQYHTMIQESLNLFYKSITDDTKVLLKTMDTQSIKEFITNFEVKTSVMFQNIQQPIYSFISATEDRLNTNINTLKDTQSQKIIGEIGDFIGKMNHDSEKTQSLHNKQLSSVLTKMYNTAEITTNPTMLQTGNQGGSILLKRLRKTNIIIENRDASENINMDEINTFLTLIDDHNCNGIFISQHSGISTKKNYQIEITNSNNIVVYLHNVEYSSAKIESAVDIIDNLSNKLRLLKGTVNIEDISIPKDILENINTEYQLFISQKNAVIEVFKESQKKVLAQIDELRFPCLDKYLATKFSAPIQKPGLKCDLCKSFTANNLKALAAHKRGCNRKMNISNTLATNIVVTNANTIMA